MKCRFTTTEVRSNHKEELAAMRYIVGHSRHQTTDLGAAPNITVTPREALEEQRKRYEQESRYQEVRVLRFDA